jgi:hypothetical protein
MAQDQDDDLAREIRAHLDTEAEDLAAQGMPEREAHTTARRRFGNVTATREHFYESQRAMWVDGLRRDLIQTLRAWRRAPGFATLAILTLALGIGVNAAVVTVADTILLRPWPYADVSRLVIFSRLGPDGFNGGFDPTAAGEWLERLQSVGMAAAFSTRDVVVQDARSTRLI